MNIIQKYKSTYKGLVPSQTLIKQMAGAAGLQALQMLISAAIGFIIVRSMNKDDYAIFNLLIAGTSTLLGLGGMAIMGTFIPFSNRIGISQTELRSTTIIFRKLNTPLFLIGMVMTIIFWIVSAYNNNWLHPIFILSMCLAFIVGIFQYYYRFPESAYKVSGQPLLPFQISIKSELIRFVLVVLVIMILSQLKLNTYICLMLMGVVLLSSCWSLLTISKRFSKLEKHGATVTSEHKSLFWSLLRPLLFPSYFFFFSQFFRGWLIYLISGTSVIAEAAALGRLMMLFAMMDKAVELVIIPRLGSISDPKKFISRLSLSFFAVFLIGFALLISAAAFPAIWLWILGDQYTNLGMALLWAVAAAGIERLSGLVLFAQLARGDSKNQWWVPLLSTGIYMIYVAFVGLDSAEKATFGLFIAAAFNLLAQIGILLWRLMYLSSKKTTDL